MRQELPIPSNETERLQALDSYNIMDSLPEERLDDLTKLAAEICDVPICLISLVDKDRQWFKSKVGLGADETPRDISFCQYAIMDVDIFEVENAKEDVRFKDNPLVNEDPNIRFYAGHPLVDDGGFALGTLCVIDDKPKTLKENQKRALAILAKEIVTEIQTKKIRKEKEVYQKFFNTSYDLLCVASKDGFFKRLSPSFTTLLGWSKEELLSRPFSDFIHPDDTESTFAEVAKLEQGLSMVGFENRYSKKDGSWAWIHWTCNPDMETGDLYASGHDITELKKSLSETNDIRHALDEASIVAITDQKGIINYVNDKFVEISKYDRDELIGKDHRILNSGFHSKEFIQNIWTTIANGNTWRGQIKNKAKDNSFYWVDTTIVPIKNQKNKPTRYIAIRHDITEVKELQERLQYANSFQQGILDGTDRSIISTDLNGIIKSFNKGAEKLLGYTAEELIGKESPAIFHDMSEVEKRAIVLTEELNEKIPMGFDVFIAKTLKTKESDENEWTYIRKDKKRIPVILSISAIWNEKNEAIGFIGIASDDSERSSFIKEIQIKNKELDQFSYVVSHDLKAPLRAINNLAGWIEEDLEITDKDVQNNFNLLKGRVQRMEDLINGILKYSKVGRQSIEKENVDFNQLINEAFDIVNSEQKCEIVINSKHPTLAVKQILWFQVYSNIISNAIKYNDKEKCLIEFDYELINEQHHFRITDNGPGIEKQFRERIFGVFQTLEARDTYESTGIGLAIVKKILDDAKGTVEIEDTPSPGTTFLIKLPLV